MNHYRINDLKIGMKESFSKKVTAEMMEAFYEITGDENPLHRDENFARQKGYSDRVVYGMLTSSFVSTLAGVYLPGELSVIQGVELKMRKPVYIDDILTITGEIKDIHESVAQVETAITIVNQHDEAVCKGKLKTGFLKDE